MSLSQLNARLECDELVLWGKINGLKNDYYIAMGLQFRDCYEFPTKTFYWALSTDFEFKDMPSLTAEYNEKINSDNSYFVGEPARKIVSAKPEGTEEGEEAEPVQEEDDEGEAKEKAAAKNSDETEEEEIKVPLRDLTGKFPFFM